MLWSVLLLLGGLTKTGAQADRCGSVWQSTERTEANEQFIERWSRNYSPSATPRAVRTIPVVVHVVYRNLVDNIPDDRIFDAIDALNADFRATTDVSVVPAQFSDLIADTEIEFCLAGLDDTGQLAILRRQTTIPGIGTATQNGQARIFYTDLGGSDPIEPAQYLNLYVAEMSGTIGRGIFPDQAGPIEDGVILSFDVFGSGDYLDPPYNQGRTLTHEVGHYLNLRHVWGNDLNDCAEDDLVNDTPNTGANYLGDCVTTGASCGSADMPTNFMYYTDDACMANFTPDQKVRMLATLAGPRAGLGEGCLPVSTHETKQVEIQISPNPATDQIQLTVTEPILSVRIGDAQGRWRKVEAQRVIDVSDLPKGIYWLEVRTTFGVGVARFLRL